MGGESSNRLFIILAIALIGLICIGLVGLGGVLFLTGANQAQEEAVVPSTPTPFPPTFTPTPTETLTPTLTPEPTKTPTPVINTPTPVPTEDDGASQGDEEATPVPTVDPETVPTNTSVSEGATAETPAPEDPSAVVATETPVPPTVTPETIPDSGGVLSETDNGFLLWAGGGLILVLLIYGVYYHRFRSSVVQVSRKK